MASVGLETGSTKILNNINKKTTLEQHENFINLIREYGINDKCSISIGHPGESNQTLEETDKMLKAARDIPEAKHSLETTLRRLRFLALRGASLAADERFKFHIGMNAAIANVKLAEVVSDIATTP
jgi:hypothetical protein